MTLSSPHQETRLTAKALDDMRPLKILMILHMPWTRDLGAPKVSVEIAEELQKHGHQIDKFDIYDAFPKSSKLLAYFQMALFPGRAARFVRAHGQRYDVIQAEQGNLPYTKRELNFTGVLIARTNGLAHFYDEYERNMKKKLLSRGERRGSLVGNTLRTVAKLMDGGLKNVETSFDTADAIVLVNQDEMDFVGHNLGHADKSYFLPSGLSEDRFAEFAAWRVDPAERLPEQQVVFVGQWGERKGSDDFPNIVRLVRQEAPGASFLLLGTGTSAEAVRACFSEQDRAAVKVVPRYSPPELPRLLAKSTVGIFPSYIEGFPSGVLEQLAGGLPTIAYDVPGTREILKHFPGSVLVPAGDTEAAANALVKLLGLPPQEYAIQSAHALKVADTFHWHATANQMLGIYADKLKELGRL